MKVFRSYEDDVTITLNIGGEQALLDEYIDDPDHGLDGYESSWLPIKRQIELNNNKVNLTFDVYARVWEEDGRTNPTEASLVIDKFRLYKLEGEEIDPASVGFDENALSRYIKEVLTPSIDFKSSFTGSVKLTQLKLEI